MTDYSDASFFAISTIGYGRGFTPDEAVSNYYDTQVSNFAHLHRLRAKRREIIAEAAPPTVWEAPEGTEGFTTDGSRVFWLRADGSQVPVESDPIDVPGTFTRAQVETRAA